MITEDEVEEILKSYNFDKLIAIEDVSIERLSAILDIEKEIVEICEIQNELNKLVEDQGQKLEMAESLVSNSQQNVTQARKTLRQAVKLKYSRLKTKLGLSGLVLGTCAAGLYTASGPIAIASGIVAGTVFTFIGKRIQKTSV